MIVAQLYIVRPYLTAAAETNKTNSTISSEQDWTVLKCSVQCTGDVTGVGVGHCSITFPNTTTTYRLVNTATTTNQARLLSNFQ